MPSLYHKTYRGFHKQEFTRKRKFNIISISILFILDIVFSILLTIWKVLKAIVPRVVPVVTKLCRIIYKLFFKAVLLGSYRFLLRINRGYKHFLPIHRNPIFFLFSNRYVSHTVAILIILITTIHNIQIRNVRAEDFGKTALFGKLVTGETFIEEYEEVVIADILPTPPQSLQSSTQNIPYVAQKIRLTDEPEEISTTTLIQGGSAIVKPSVPETFDTPKPRESTTVYTVKEDDNVFNIAQEFNVSVNTILWANKLTSRSIIRPGDELRVLPVSGVEHAIKSGETISSIASKYNIPQEDILEINKLAMTDAIDTGELLIIPDGQPLYTPKPRIPRDIVPTIPKYVPPTTEGATDLFWPTDCRRITQYFRGWRHTGVDIACGMGVNVYAAADGIVEQAGEGWNGGYGNRIIIRHNDGSKTLYAHLKNKGILVSPGQYVKKGQIIGLMGSSGRSTGPHVHFEVIISGSRVNPFNRL